MDAVAGHPDWWAAALCAQVAGDFWYPVKGSPVTAAERICRSCPVRPPCLEDALSRADDWGIWGGFPAGRRRPLIRQYRAGRPVEDMIAEDDARFYARLEARRAA